MCAVGTVVDFLCKIELDDGILVGKRTTSLITFGGTCSLYDTKAPKTCLVTAHAVYRSNRTKKTEEVIKQEWKDNGLSLDT